MNFTFPTGTNWLLLVARYRRPFKENIEAAIFTWWRLFRDISGPFFQSDFEHGQCLDPFKQIMTPWLGDGVLFSVNYYMQSAGLKYSNAVDKGLSLSPITDIMPLGQGACVRRYSGVRGDKYEGRLNWPCVPIALLDSDATWGTLMGFPFSSFHLNYLGGFNINGGNHCRPVVYRPTSDTFVDITDLKLLDRPTWTYRRRFRQRKVGHVVTAPLQWAVPGHF